MAQRSSPLSFRSQLCYIIAEWLVAHA
jgi:hypothetical protein